MTKQEIIEKLKTELDINQRLFLAHRFHSTQFNEWFEKALTEFEQVVREETIETCLDIVFAETYPFDGKVVRVFDDPNVAYKIIKNLLKN